MPLRKTEFVNNEIYHIIIRGVDGRSIFSEENDCWRAIFSLYEFNNRDAVNIRDRRTKAKDYKQAVNGLRDAFPLGPSSGIFQRKKMIEVLAFVFMHDHIHFLIKQTGAMGITDFMRKFGTGYAMYFNNKYERKGALFQGRFYAEHIDNNEYLKTVFVYIQTNPISIIEPGWKQSGIQNKKAAKSFLEKYRWSSYLDYMGNSNFPSVTERSVLLKVFKGKENLVRFVEAWIGYKNRYNIKPSLGPS